MVDDQVIKIGLFTEGKFLSNGTFADAYEINDDNGNPAILKWLRADAPKGGVERFQNESWALRQLSHPSIPHYISEGEHEGRPYIVMARAPGFSLRKRLNVAVGERGTFG